MEPVLELSHVNYAYHTMDGETKALNDISFSVAPGEFVAFVGPSGCGKSTLLSILSGLLKTETGQIRVNGKDLKDSTTNIGYMLQHDHLFEWRTIYHNVLLGLEIQHMLTGTHTRQSGRTSRTLRSETFCRLQTVRTFRRNAPESRADPDSGT